MKASSASDTNDVLIEIRRHQSTLMTSGSAVIALSLWSFVKTMLMAFAVDDKLATSAHETFGPEVTGTELAVYYAVFVVLLLLIGIIVLGPPIYVGRSAIAEGMGKPKGSFYVVLADLLMVVNVISSVSICMHAGGLLKSLEALFTCLIDLSFSLALLDLMVAAVKVRRLNKLVHAGE